MTGLTTQPEPRGEKVIRCAWLINPETAPQQNMRVTVVDGSVVEICATPHDELSQVAALVLMPSFVNAHTHLEFSQLTSPLPPPLPFPGWIRSVIQYRAANSDDDHFAADSMRAGVHESHAAGVRLIGEISTTEISVDCLRPLLQQTRNSAVSFRELIGFSAEQMATQMQTAERHVAAQSTAGTDDGEGQLVRGLSPHAPYSVHPDLFAGIVDLASHTKAPVAMHLAETVDEVQLLADQTGEFVEFLRTLGLWDSQMLRRGTTPLRYLEKLAQAERALAVHGNYFGTAEIAFLARHPHVAVVYCPRTHAWFGHPPHPWQQLRSAGATVVLGTDSRASNPDLNLWKELQVVAGRKNSPPLTDLLPMITTDAAQALGFSGNDFRIQVGNRFHAVSVPCACDQESGVNAALLRSAVVAPVKL